jgi:hypothetical protein
MIDRMQMPKTRWQEIREQASIAFQSGCCPSGIRSVYQAIYIAKAGDELGLPVMQSLAGLYIVNGQIALRGSLMLRLIYERVPGARIQVMTPPERSQYECEVEMQRPGGPTQRFRFTLAEAETAGFMKKQLWREHTATMLRWAAIRTGARVVFADAIAGCYMEDEVGENKSPPPSPAITGVAAT